MNYSKMTKEELKGYIKAFKKFAGYALTPEKFNKELEKLTLYQKTIN
jgi:hypothetical protein